MFSIRMLHLILILILINLSLSNQTDETISVTVKEELESGTFLIDVKKEAIWLNTNSSNFQWLKGNELEQFFLLENNSGVIRMKNRLDREHLCPGLVECIKKLLIVSKKPNISIIKIDIDIEDINDNPPIFNISDMKTNISESAQLGVFYQLHPAEDLDSPKYGVINYFLDPSQDSINMKRFQLKVDKIGDKVVNIELHSSESLDREEQNLYNLRVIAIDGGQPAKSGYANIEINVLDLNDNYPQFSEKKYMLNVTENTIPNKVLFRIEATDKDFDLNGDVEYAFSEKTKKLYNEYFKIDKISGNISQIKTLDYEKFQTILLEIIAKDRGNEPLSSKSIIEIKVKNINDNSPKIKFSETNGDKNSITLPENVPLGTHVVQFTVTDDDGEENISCSIKLNKSEAMPFLMKKKQFTNEFIIETNDELDFEYSSQLIIMIECADGGNPLLSNMALFNVNIRDVNDNPPKFTSNIYNITILENNTPFERMNFNIKATDEDSGLNGVIHYSIKSHPNEVFDIDERSAELWTTISLDREKNSFYKFEVVATDGGDYENNSSLPRSSSAVVTVSVEDVNDEPPRFRQPMYNFSIIENKQSKTELGQLLVKDLDLRSKTVFQLESNYSRIFKVDSKSGKLYAIKSLNREEKSYYTFNVTAKDEEIHKLYDEAVVNVFVTDENDNPPVIDFPTSGNDTVYISRNIEIGTLITKVIAKDLDEGNNSLLVYTISQSTPENLFKLDAKTGELFLNSLLPEYQNSFSLVVMVKDTGDPIKMTVATLEIFVDAVSAVHSFNRPLTMQRIFTEAHLAVVVGVATGCLLIIFVLICVVCTVSHQKPTKRSNAKYTSENDKSLTKMYESSIKINPYKHDGLNDENKENNSQLRESILVGNETNLPDAFIMANLNNENNVPSPITIDRRSSKLYSTEMSINAGTGKYYQCDSPGFPVDNMIKNPSAFKNVTYVDCCHIDSISNSGLYQSRPIYTSPDYNDNVTPTTSSPDWLLQAVEQRKQSFSRWLNCENSNVQNKVQPYGMYEYSTIPSLNRITAYRFNDDLSSVTKSLTGNNQQNNETVTETRPLILRNNFPTRSSPTYVGLYSGPYISRPIISGSSIENDSFLKSLQEKVIYNHNSIAEEVQ